MKTRPDIVLFLTDQQRFDQVGYASDGHFETPNLDRLARSGVIFENAYSASTVCVPARVALMTGFEPHRVPTQENPFALREGFWTVAHQLRRAGYETALIGKAHFAPVHAQHGFETLRLCEHLERARSGPPESGAERRARRLPRLAAGRRLSRLAFRWPGPGGQAGTLRVPVRRGRSPDGLGGARGDGAPRAPGPHPAAVPGCLVPPPACAVQPARALCVDVRSRRRSAARSWVRGERTPADGVPAGAGERHHARPLRQTSTTYGICSRPSAAWSKHVDDAIGRLVACLDLASTLVAFTSDHGDYAGHRGLLRKIPWMPFDDLARVPLIYAGHGVVGGRVVADLVQSYDFAQTALDAAGVPPGRGRFRRSQPAAAARRCDGT